MNMWARIENELVAEIVAEDPAGRFHADLFWVPCTSNVLPGWRYEGGVFMAPPAPDIDPVVVSQMRLAAYRAESDPIKLEAEYDALIAGTEPDYSRWLEAVARIKTRYPLPA